MLVLISRVLVGRRPKGGSTTGTGMKKTKGILSVRRAGGLVACAALAASASADVMTAHVPARPLSDSYTQGAAWQFAMQSAGNHTEFDRPGLEAKEAVDPFLALAERGVDADPIRDAAEMMAVDLTPVELVLYDGLADVKAVPAAEKRCLAQAIYYEARNQTSAGQMAVADVVLNRVDSDIYPDTVCGVVYQGSDREIGCQFSFTCDGSLDRPVDVMAMKDAQKLATAVLSGLRVELTRGAYNYHAKYVAPYWAPRLHKTAEIDDHVFYTPTRYAQASGPDISGQ